MKAVQAQTVFYLWFPFNYLLERRVSQSLAWLLFIRQCNNKFDFQCTFTLGRGIPLYKLYRYVPPHRVGFLRRFGLKTSIHFARFGLESGMVFEEATGLYERLYRFNSKWVRKKEKYANYKWIWSSDIIISETGATMCEWRRGCFTPVNFSFILFDFVYAFH